MIALQFLIPVPTGRPVPFASGETNRLGYEVVGSYLTKVHLQHELESNNYGIFLSYNARARALSIYIG